METILWDGSISPLRWLHVIAGIAWIGSVVLLHPSRCQPARRDGLPEGVGGEAWQVHGGGFYHMPEVPGGAGAHARSAHWFKWEAYTTWITGFVLLVVLYYLGAELYLIDPRRRSTPGGRRSRSASRSLAPAGSSTTGCAGRRSARNERLLGALGFVFLVRSLGSARIVFSGRGAFMHVGALIGTIMVANVFS